MTLRRGESVPAPLAAPFLAAARVDTFIQTFRTWESYYYQSQAGALDDRLWAGFKVQLCDVFGYPGVREIWSARHHQLSEEFREFVDNDIAGAESKPLYVVQ